MTFSEYKPVRWSWFNSIQNNSRIITFDTLPRRINGIPSCQTKRQAVTHPSLYPIFRFSASPLIVFALISALPKSFRSTHVCSNTCCLPYFTIPQLQSSLILTRLSLFFLINNFLWTHCSYPISSHPRNKYFSLLGHISHTNIECMKSCIYCKQHFLVLGSIKK